MGCDGQTRPVTQFLQTSLPRTPPPRAPKNAISTPKNTLSLINTDRSVYFLNLNYPALPPAPSPRAQFYRSLPILTTKTVQLRSILAQKRAVLLQNCSKAHFRTPPRGSLNATFTLPRRPPPPVLPTRRPPHFSPCHQPPSPLSSRFCVIIQATNIA